MRQTYYPQICFVGPLPPPTHGMAAVNAEMVNRLINRAKVKIFPVMPDPGSHGARYHLTKTVRLLVALVGLIAARLGGCRIFYGSVDDGWGGAWTNAIAFVARACGYRIYFHHHSFRYVNRRAWLIEILTRIAGPDACHVMLCEVMETAFRAKYPSVGQTVVVPNIVAMPLQLTPTPQHEDFVIGILSNLMFEKGVREVVDLFEAAQARGMRVSAVIAGPAWNQEVEAYLIDAVSRNNGNLQWIGPVYGGAKERFFCSIDVFIFPTNYASECYPLVLVEALCRGKPVISNDQGCISALAGLQSVDVVSTSQTFVEAALPLLERLAAKTRDEISTQARADATKLIGEAAHQWDNLVGRVIGC